MSVQHNNFRSHPERFFIKMYEGNRSGFINNPKTVHHLFKTELRDRSSPLLRFLSTINNFHSFFKFFFLVDLPFSILVFHASLGKVTVNLFINIDHIIINYKSMISKSLISTFLSKSEWIIRTIFFKTMSIPNYDEVTFRKYIKVTFFKG